MAEKYRDMILTPAVQAAEDHYYGRHQAHKPGAPVRDRLTDEELEFIASRDSFYLGIITETGWPYVQHRGGPKGFLKVLAPNQLGFADFVGNHQLVSTGSLATNDRVALFLMDYPQQWRLKMLGHAKVLDARAPENAALADQLAPEGLRDKVERLFLIEIVSFDWNCPQYITPRYTAAEIEPHVAALKARIAELEAQLSVRSGKDGKASSA